jgi:hypothetical protein
MSFDVRKASAAFRGYFGEPRNLFKHALRDGILRQIEFPAAEIGAIGIAGMGANR